MSTVKPAEEGTCVAFLDNGKGQCGKRAIYRDGEYLFCGTHYPYHIKAQRAKETTDG